MNNWVIVRKKQVLSKKQKRGEFGLEIDHPPSRMPPQRKSTLCDEKHAFKYPALPSGRWCNDLGGAGGVPRTTTHAEPPLPR